MAIPEYFLIDRYLPSKGAQIFSSPSVGCHFEVESVSVRKQIMESVLGAGGRQVLEQRDLPIVELLNPLAESVWWRQIRLLGWVQCERWDRDRGCVKASSPWCARDRRGDGDRFESVESRVVDEIESATSEGRRDVSVASETDMSASVQCLVVARDVVIPMSLRPVPSPYPRS